LVTEQTLAGTLFWLLLLDGHAIGHCVILCVNFSGIIEHV